MKNHILKFMMLFIILVSSCKGIESEEIAQKDIISLSIYDDNDQETYQAIGNGTSKIKLKVTLPSNISDDYKLVTFTSTGGYFSGTAANNTQEKIDLDGNAEATLVLPLDSGDLFLTAQIGKDNDIYESKKTVVLTAVNKIIELKFKNFQDQDLVTIPRANGVSLIKVEGDVLVNKKVLNSITFTATDGLFQVKNEKTETKKTNIDGVAIVNYIVPQKVGTVFFTANTGTDGKYSAFNELKFEGAYADSLILEPTNFSMDTISTNTINAYLKRQVGKVSIDTEVCFKAYQIINGAKVDVGRFIGSNNTKSDINEKVSINFLADTKNIDYDLPVFIRAESVNDSNVVIFKELELKVE